MSWFTIQWLALLFKVYVYVARIYFLQVLQSLDVFQWCRVAWRVFSTWRWWWSSSIRPYLLYTTYIHSYIHTYIHTGHAGNAAGDDVATSCDSKVLSNRLCCVVLCNMYVYMHLYTVLLYMCMYSITVYMHVSLYIFMYVQYYCIYACMYSISVYMYSNGHKKARCDFLIELFKFLELEGLVIIILVLFLCII